MKTTSLPLNRILPLACCGLSLAFVHPLIAAEDILIDNFTDPASALKTVKFWGGATQTYEHDASEDSGGDPSSGALKITVGYDLAARGGDNQMSARRQLDTTPVDGTKYAKLEFDIKYDPSSVAQGTNYGNMEVGIAHTDWSQYYFATVQTPVGTTGWRKISVNVNQLDPKLDQLRDFHFKLWSGGGDGMTGTQVFWIDNVKLIALPSTEPPLPPPTISIESSVAGLNVISSGNGQYDRQTLRTTTPQYSWVGAGAPVTYSITVADYSKKPGMGTVFYLVPGTGLGTGDNYPDYGQPRCIAGYLSNNANGTGNLRLAFKNELANSNGQSPNDLYGNGDLNNLWPDNPAWVEGNPKKPGTGIGGTLCSVNGASMLGKWSITFTSNTSVTITSPSGQTATGTLPNEATAQLFADPMYAYFGTLPGEPVRIGEKVVFSGIEITGGANQINTDIPTAMSEGLLEKSASAPTGIVFINPTETPYWFFWSLPASGYKLQQSMDLGIWEDLATTGSINAPGGQRLLLNASNLSNLNKNFLRMTKPLLVP